MWETELAEIERQALTANKLIEGITDELAQFAFQAGTERLWASLPLLKSSIDIGASATKLLLSDPVGYGIAALALHRPQVEQFCRGVFFGASALTTEKEVSRFLKKDQMPERPNSKGKLAPIELQALADAVAKEIAKHGTPQQQGQWEKFPNMVAFAKKVMNSAIHGGNVVSGSYYNDMVCFDPTKLADGELITNCAVIALLAMTQIGQLQSPEGGRTKVSFTPAFQKLFDEFFDSLPTNSPKPQPL